MTPRRLRYFLAIAEAGSVTRAARILGVAQPALSQHLQALEAELDVRLLERHARGVRPTEAGERLMRHARALERQLERIAADVRDPMAGDAVGTVNICLAASLASVVAPALLMRVAEHAPALELIVHSLLSVRAQRMLLLGEADLALLPSVSDVDGLQSQPIYTERLQLLGVPELLESLPDPVPVRMLERVSLALPSRGHDLRRYLDGLAAGAGVSLRTRFTVDGPDITRSLVEAGLCCAVLPRSMVGVHDSRIAARRLVRPVPGRTLSIAWLADRPMTRAIRLVRQNLVETMRALVASGGLDGRLVADRFVSHDLDTD